MRVQIKWETCVFFYETMKKNSQKNNNLLIYRKFEAKCSDNAVQEITEKNNNKLLKRFNTTRS